MSSRSETSLKDTKYVPECLKWMLIAAAILIAIGAMNVYNATYYMNMAAGDGPYTHFVKHVGVLALGLAIGAFVAWLPKGFIRGGAFVWVGVTILLLAVVVVAGHRANGATRWIMLAGFSLQPSEVAKVTGLIWTASFLAKRIRKGEKITLIKRLFHLFFLPFFHLFGRKKKEDTFRSMIGYFLPLYGPLVMALFVLKQPDMGTAGMILLFPVLLYVVAGLPIFEIFLGVGGAIVTFAILVIAEPYRMDRVVVLWDPFSYAANRGYQTVQSLIAVGSGGFFGQSIGEGMSKFLYLPEQYTDFAYAVFSQEFGFIGSVFVLILYLIFLLAGFSAARKLKETYAALLVYGLTMLISVQGIVNIAMVIGCFPVTGIPLPFISYGGSSLLMNIISVALIYGTTVQSLRETDLEERKRRIAQMEGRG